MKKFALLLAILIIAGCGGAKKKEQKVSGTVEELVPVKDSLINPAGGLFDTDYKYIFFGKIGYRDRAFREDTLLFPPMQNLAHKSVYVKCPKDTCFAEYAVLALRCPPIGPLLNWLSDTVSVFANNCPIGHGLVEFSEESYEIPAKHLKSDNEICDYYMGRLQHVYDGWHCSGEAEHDVVNEQAGLLIADCWKVCNLYTFYRIDWYEHLCGGNNSRESFWTVDATTGKQLTCEDMVNPEMRDSLAALMVQRLVNGHGEYYIRQYEHTPDEYIDVLNRANGCALIEEGLIIYFYPYNLGSGADGEYEAVIPYEELDGILSQPLSLLLVPLHEEELDITTHEITSSPPLIDLLGVKLAGSPRRILQEMNMNPFFSVIIHPWSPHASEGYVYCEILIDGQPFEMQLYGEDEDWRHVHFISADADDKVFRMLRKNLTNYYGQPEVDSGDVGGLTWFPDGHFMKARHLHHEEGGWTFFIQKSHYLSVPLTPTDIE